MSNSTPMNDSCVMVETDSVGSLLESSSGPKLALLKMITAVRPSISMRKMAMKLVFCRNRVAQMALSTCARLVMV